MIRTAVVVETLPRGRWLAWPFADPSLIQFGRPEDDPRVVMALVLPEHLQTLPGSARSRFATPAGTRLGTTSVALERTDLPKRLARAFTIAVPWLVTPYGKDLWLHVPPLKLTLRVDDPAAIDTLVASEVRRLFAAMEPSPDQILELFPALAHRLEWIDVSLARPASEVRATTAKTIAKMEAHQLLSSVASAVHADARVLEGAPLVARPTELQALDRLLAAHSVLVHGPELAGKTALVEGWVRARLASPEPRSADTLPSLLVYATSGARLMAGMSLLGQWQERLRRVLAAVATLEAVLWIEDLGELLGESGDGDELGRALRPWLEDGRVRVVSELRDDAIDRMERRHPALFATLRRVRVAPLGVADTLQVLEARRLHLREREPDRPRLSSAALPELVALSGRYQSTLALPGAAVRLAGDLEGLAASERPAARLPELDAAAVQRLYAALTGLPAWLVDDRRAFELEVTRAALSQRVIGQDAAVRAVAESLALVKTRLAARGKPLSSFLFTGPTGVGKTELARALAEHLFGSAQRLVRFDMSEFMDALAAERLIRGGDGQRDGLLTRRLRREPLCVVLLDEIEKAHKSVFDLLLQALGDGRLTDAAGRTASLEGAIVILTSNLGASDRTRAVGLLDEAPGTLERHYLAAVRRHFAPELVNRLDRIVPFAALGTPELTRIVRLQLARVRARRGLRGIDLQVSDAALDLVALQGTTAEYGARALRRAVDRLLVNPLARAITEAPARHVIGVEVDVGQGAAGPELTFTRRERVPIARRETVLGRIGRLRRAARATWSSPSVREVKDRLEHLDADLLRGAKPGPILVERAHLEGLLAPVSAIVEELEQLEDILYMDAAQGRAPTPEVEAELELAQRRFDELGNVAFELMTATEPRRDHALVALTELDDHRAFDRWLVPLLEAVEARGWSVTGWIEGERGESWPAIGLGPPLGAAELYTRILDRPSDFRHLVLGVRGRHAGTLLACEAGLVSFRPSSGPIANLFVKVLSTLRHSVRPDELEATSVWVAPPSDTRGPMANGARARTFFPHTSKVVLLSAGRTLTGDGGAADYFATWERWAGHCIGAHDEHTTLERGDLFVSPLDDELMLAKLARDAAEEAEAERTGGRR